MADTVLPPETDSSTHIVPQPGAEDGAWIRGFEDEGGAYRLALLGDGNLCYDIVDLTKAMGLPFDPVFYLSIEDRHLDHAERTSAEIQRLFGLTDASSGRITRERHPSASLLSASLAPRTASASSSGRRT